MNSTEFSKDERERIFNWAKENYSDANNILTKKVSACESYFVPFNQEDNVVEYDFSTLPQLKENLLKMWSNDDAMEKVALICSVAAFKSKPADKVIKADSKIVKDSASEDFYIPDFVYAF